MSFYNKSTEKKSLFQLSYQLFCKNLGKYSENLFYLDYSVDFYSRKEYYVKKRKTSKGIKSMTFANMTVLLLRNEG